MSWLLASVKRNLSISMCKRSSRVADESSLGPLALEQGQERGPGHLSLVLAIIRAPMAVATCFIGSSNGVEEVWASGERPRTAEMDHLMVRDSMRYAIYV